MMISRNQFVHHAAWARKGMMDLKTWDSWALPLSQYQNSILHAPVEQCMSFHIGINSEFGRPTP
jgi:hypothetical protein